MFLQITSLDRLELVIGTGMRCRSWRDIKWHMYTCGGMKRRNEYDLGRLWKSCTISDDADAEEYMLKIIAVLHASPLARTLDKYTRLSRTLERKYKYTSS